MVGTHQIWKVVYNSSLRFMNLVVVESPTKARKLSEYLGKDYVVEASIGHVRDLPKNKLGVDIEKNFEPTYVVDPEKKKVIDKLQKLAAKAETVYLATDPDREGEAIAWHIQHLLSKTKANFARSTFHEITKPAVMEAISKPGVVSEPLVDAQQARRVMDRLVGYQVSPVLWKKIRRGLSAGRVQSVALRLIAEREREIAQFKAEEYWEVDVLVAVNQAATSNKSLAELITNTKAKVPTDFLISRVTAVEGKKYEPHHEADVTPVLTDLKEAEYQVATVERKSRERSSLPPFTTSTLQQAAATRLGFTSKQTMSLAQQLYEEGLITYHRTDSVNLSQASLQMARSYIQDHFGVQYLPEKPRYFSQKSKNAQEAHEAIRVTDVAVKGEVIIARSSKFTNRHVQLYDLIWRRFLASQMKSAVYDQTAITISAQPTSTTKTHQHYTLRTAGSILKFDGWMKLFSSQEDVILPSVTEGQQLFYHDQYAAQKFTQPPPRYNDASLVKELEKRGIGRPSTYASIISVIVDRGYVERQDKRFVATPIGLTVNDFLMHNFATFMDYDFTAEMEENLDRISLGEKEWHTVIKDFYTPLAATISSVVKEAERVSVPVEETGEQCPLCGETEGGQVVIRTGRYGKFRSCNRFPDCKYTQNIVEKMDDMVCPLCQQGEVIIKKSRWGKNFFGCSRYPDCDWASWTKPDKDLKLTKAEWSAMQQARAEKKAQRAATAPKTTRKGTARKTTKRKSSKRTTA